MCVSKATMRSYKALGPFMYSVLTVKLIGGFAVGIRVRFNNVGKYINKIG